MWPALIAAAASASKAPPAAPINPMASLTNDSSGWTVTTGGNSSMVNMEWMALAAFALFVILKK